ncbi:unnamed protein product [Closterium sp. NIES-65]|nr:unnamed protein product [Closterium sp. NIES-65]
MDETESQHCSVPSSRVTPRASCTSNKSSAPTAATQNKRFGAISPSSLSSLRSLLSLSLFSHTPLPGFGTMADFFPTKELFMTKLFGAVIGLIGKLNYTVKIKPGASLFGAVVGLIGTLNYTVNFKPNNEACYNGPKALPATTLCCDPLKVPRTCPRGTVSFKENPEFRPFVGRQIDSKGCTENPSLAMLGTAPDAGTAGKKSAGGGGGRGSGAVLGLVLSWLGVWLAWVGL